jgi:hypothetical protein
MFPWVCLSSSRNYSKIISECYSSATKYMSVTEEKSITMEALKIVIEARLRKLAVFAKHDIKSPVSNKHRHGKSISQMTKSINITDSLPTETKEGSKETGKETKSKKLLTKLLSNDSKLSMVSPTRQKLPALPLSTKSNTVIHSPSPSDIGGFFITSPYNQSSILASPIAANNSANIL